MHVNVVRVGTGASCALLAARLATACSAGPVTSYQPTEDTCYHLATAALQRHIVLPAGLGTWIAFVANGLSVLAWVALGMVVLIAGLGMGVLAASLPEPARASVTGRPAGPPVTAIAAHGTLATLTILLVLLAAIGAG